MQIWRCKKCEKVLPDYRRCDVCGSWPLKDNINRITEKEAHMLSYDAMVRDKGKAFADKHWKK